MVLAIGIFVDDAIVVIENVERIMTEEHLDPHAATRKAMKQITGAIIAITVVLTAVFVPSALQPGATGVIYAQFALTLAVSMALSAFLALSFTPALCAALLRPERHEGRHLLFRWFDRAFNSTAHMYQGHVGSAVRHAPRWMMLFALVGVLTGFLYLHMPTSFVPDEDQGFLLALVNLPPDATLQRTDQVMSQIRSKLLHGPLGKDISGVFQPEGFSFVGTSENVGMAFIKLTDWSKRSQTAMQLIPQVNKLLASISGAQIFAVNLPTIRGLSRFGGIDLYLLARTGQTHQQLDSAGKTLIAAAAKDPLLTQVRENALPSASQLDISVNRKQAASMGLSLSDVYATVDAEIAPLYINQMSYGGRIKRVYIQDEPKYRMDPDALHQLYTPSADLPLNSARPPSPGTGSPTSPDDMIPLSSVIDAKWIVGPAVLQRYDGYPALEIVGNPGAGFTTGQAMNTVRGIVRKSLPPGYGAEWT